MSLCATVYNAFRHSIWFFPNDVLTQVPTVCSQRKGEHPRNANEVFGFQTFWWFYASAPRLRFNITAAFALASRPLDATAPGLSVRIANV
jgi:hypothetical protein